MKNLKKICYYKTSVIHYFVKEALDKEKLNEMTIKHFIEGVCKYFEWDENIIMDKKMYMVRFGENSDYKKGVNYLLNKGIIKPIDVLRQYNTKYCCRYKHSKHIPTLAKHIIDNEAYDLSVSRFGYPTKDILKEWINYKNTKNISRDDMIEYLNVNGIKKGISNLNKKQLWKKIMKLD